MLKFYFNINFTIILFLTSIMFAKSAYSDDWTIEKLNNRIIVSKNGEITHGDNLRFFITKDYCDELQEVFTFYTTNNHSNINDLKGKILTVSMNEYEVKSEVLFVLPFLLGHSAWFNMGRYKIDDHIEFFKNTSLYEVKILNDGSFIATDYFDIPHNHWNIENLKNNLEKGRIECKNL